MLMVIIAILFCWALVATIILVWHPLPIPDRGHRLFSVAGEDARVTVLEVLRRFGLHARMRFCSGPSDQTVLSDGTTVIHVLNKVPAAGNAISLVVKSPDAAAKEAIEILTRAGYQAERLDSIDAGLPPDHLAVVVSTAFSGWVIAFRRHLLRMPKPHVLPVK